MRKYWHKDRHLDEWHRLTNPKMENKYVVNGFGKEVQCNSVGKRIVFP